jgi:DNA-binding SARP family transcriptional activator
MSHDDPSPNGAAAGILRVRLFGGFAVNAGGTPLDLHYRKADRLLAYLLLRGGAAERAGIATTLWPDAESNPLDHSLRALRERLGPQGTRLEVGRTPYIRFALEGVDCDLLAFDRSAARPDDMTGLAAAVEAYGGPLLPYWNEEEDAWLRPERHRREERFRQILWQIARQARQARQQGAPEAAIPFLRRYVVAFPREERGWQDLIRALLEAGERLEAVAQYEAYRKALHQHDLRPPLPLEKAYRDLLEGSAAGGGKGEGAAGAATGGAMMPDSPYYIAREADERVGRALERSESIILLKGPRETGKSSLVARGLREARLRGSLTLLTDFQAIARQDFDSLETLCRSLIAHLSEQMEPGDTEAPEADYRPQMAATTNLERFVQRRLLNGYARRIVWALDRVDRLFDTPCGGDLFSLLRSWHDRRAYPQYAGWRRLTIIVACATEARLYIPDLDRSPFNVGITVELSDLDHEQVLALHGRYGEPLERTADLEAVFHLLGGHPFLTSRAFALLSARSLSVGELMATADQDDGPFGGHLRRTLDTVTDAPALCAAVRAALAGRGCREEEFYRLRSAGILAGPSSAEARLRCELYARYFGRKLGERPA